jgi:MSHA biogenesis protein MshI
LLISNLFRKSRTNKGIVGISRNPQGVAIACTSYRENQKISLDYCEFIPFFNNTDFASTIRQLASQHNLDDYDCHIVLNSEDYRRINIDALAVAEDEMHEAIRWKINDLIDMPADKATIDFYPMPSPARANNDKMLEVVITANDLIADLANKSKQAGLNLKVIDIQETVLRNLAVLLPENKRGVAVLYLQETTGIIIIQKEGVIYLARNLDIGYRTLGLNLVGQEDESKSYATEQNNLALEIQRSLDYVESLYGIPPISGLAVVPLAQNTQELLNILNTNHGITARIMDLTAIVDCNILLDDGTQSRCAPVIGATLRRAVEAL